MSRKDRGQPLPAQLCFDPDEPVLTDEVRVAEGPHPKFGDAPEWNLIAAGLAPNLSKSRAVLNFADIAIEWRLTAKTLAMAC